MKTVLIIAYYFPPMGMGGVQRALKFAKYLPKWGWNPIVLTVKSVTYHAYDATLLEEVKGVPLYRTDSFDPLRAGQKILSGRKKETVHPMRTDGMRLLGRINRFISDWVAIPDNKMLWIPCAARTLRKIIAKRHIDVVLTTSPPHSSHLLGYWMKRRYRIPWVADLRDNWFGDYYRKGKTPLHTALNRSLARHVLKKADRLVGVSAPISEDARAAAGKSGSWAVTIPNGYDRADFEGLPDRPDPSAMIILYAGTFNRWLSPSSFFQALRDAADECPSLRSDVQVHCAGSVMDHDMNRLIQKYGISEMVHVLGYLNHRRCLEKIMSSHLLLLIIPDSLSEGMVTGKLFEYLASGKPIFAIAPQGEAARLIRKYERGFVVPPGNTHEIAAALLNAYASWKKGLLKLGTPRWKGIAQFERQAETGELALVLASVLPIAGPVHGAP